MARVDAMGLLRALEDDLERTRGRVELLLTAQLACDGERAATREAKRVEGEGKAVRAVTLADEEAMRLRAVDNAAAPESSAVRVASKAEAVSKRVVRADEERTISEGINELERRRHDAEPLFIQRRLGRVGSVWRSRTGLGVGRRPRIKPVSCASRACARTRRISSRFRHLLSYTGDRPRLTSRTAGKLGFAP